MRSATSGLLSFVLVSSLFGCRNRGKDVNEGQIDTGTEDTAVEEEDPGTTVFTIDEDVVWEVDQVVGGVWYVPEGVTLIVRAGVQVSFLPAAGLNVDGTLLLEGTTESPVTFVNDALAASNQGVQVGGTADASALNNAAFTGVNLRLEGAATPSVSGLLMSDATLSVYSRSTGFTVADSTFSDGLRDYQAGIISRDLPSLTVTGSTFDKLYLGIQFDGLSESSSLVVQNSTFTDSRLAVQTGVLQTEPVVLTMSDSQVTNMSGYGLYLLRTAATLTNVQFQTSQVYGIYGDEFSTVDLTSVTVDDTQEDCIRVGGGVQADGLAVSNCGNSGIVVTEGNLDVTNSTITDVVGYGAYAKGNVNFSSSSVTGSDSHCVHASRGSATVTDSTLSTCLLHGIYAYLGSVTATGVTLSNVEGNALYAHTGTLTVENTTITGVRGNALASYRGDVVVNSTAGAVVVSDVQGNGVNASDGAATLDGLDLSDIRKYGVYAAYGDVVASNVSITDVGLTGIYVSYADITGSNIQVETAGASGIYASRGDINVSAGAGTLEVRDTVEHGVYAYRGDATVSGGTIINTGSVAVQAYYGDVIISNTSIQTTGSHGVVSQYGVASSVSDTTIADTFHSGVYAYAGGLMTVTDSSTTNTGAHGFYAYRQGMSLTRSNALGAGQYGIYVYEDDLAIQEGIVANVDGYGVYVYEGDATIDQLQIIDATGTGLDSVGVTGILVTDGTATISNTRVEDTDLYGIQVMGGSITNSTVTRSGFRGIVVSGDQAMTISNCEISDNVDRGVIGQSWGDNFIDVSGNNITGNGSYGVQYAQLVDGNYVSDNYTFVGADLGEGGTVDGSRDTNTDQVKTADAVSNPQSAPLTGVGAI